MVEEFPDEGKDKYSSSEKKMKERKKMERLDNNITYYLRV